jgi:hypothetical protein
MISAVRELFIKAAWAPIAVLIFHATVSGTPRGARLDFLIHFLGGVAIAYFLFHALHCFRAWLGAPSPFGRYLFSYALACTVGVFWEFAEQFSDVFLHTRIQISIYETMSDLIADATGAFTSLFLVFVTRRIPRG